MNKLTATTLTRKNHHCGSGSAERPLLPMKTSISVPPGLNWVIKQRITSVIAYSILAGEPHEQRTEVLSRLDILLSQRRDIHQVILYGYELTVLCSFLIEQEQQFDQWSAGLLPDRASRIIRADLRGLLPKLRTLCLQVDVCANRPVHDC